MKSVRMCQGHAGEGGRRRLKLLRKGGGQSLELRRIESSDALRLMVEGWEVRRRWRSGHDLIFALRHAASLSSDGIPPPPLLSSDQSLSFPLLFFLGWFVCGPAETAVSCVRRSAFLGSNEHARVWVCVYAREKKKSREQETRHYAMQKRENSLVCSARQGSSGEGEKIARKGRRGG